MIYFLFGLLFLAGVLAAGPRLARANPGQIAQVLKGAAGLVVLALATFLAVRGAIIAAIPLAGLAVLLLSGMLPSNHRTGRRSSAAQTSTVRTNTLDLELDLDTGDLSGRVTRGAFEGRAVETLSQAELIALWQECAAGADMQSAAIVEAHLDRSYPDWRAQAAGGGGPGGAGAGDDDAGMSVVEARAVLGVDADADAETIHRAHRALMARHHPDRGGSDYFASKINEARDRLLRDLGQR